MEYRHIIELRLCESPCQGQSCCDCCGKAPAIHLAGADYFRSNDGMTEAAAVEAARKSRMNVCI